MIVTLLTALAAGLLLGAIWADYWTYHRVFGRLAKPHNPLHHLQQFWHAHLLVLALLVGSFWGGGALGYTQHAAIDRVLRSGALPFTGHIAPRPPLVRAGTAGPPNGPDLQYLLPPMNLVGQGNTEACGAWTLTALTYGALKQAGSPAPKALSPWRNQWEVTGGQDRPTTMDEQVAALNAHGVELFPEWPVWGPPDSRDAAATIYLPQVSLTYIAATWPHAGGQAIVNAIKGANDHGHLVGILWAVNGNGLGAWGQDSFDNTGLGQFLHFSVVYQHRGDDLMVYNSWGASWGNPQDPGTSEMLASGARTSIYEAFTIALASPLARWLPQVTAATPTRTPAPRPTPRPQPTPVPAPAYHGVYVTTRATNLRGAPRMTARIAQGVGKGTRLRSLGAATPHWTYVTEHGHPAWAYRPFLKVSK